LARRIATGNAYAAEAELAAALKRVRRRALEWRCVLAEESDPESGKRIADTPDGRKAQRIEAALADALRVEPDPAGQLRLREQALVDIEALPGLPLPETRRVKLGEATWAG
jgi:hypothetical protein